MGGPPGRARARFRRGHAHIDVSEGQRVDRGDRGGGVGNEGDSSGPRLHCEIRRNGDPVDLLGFVSPP
jgi:murein DD-endopeptidase MepM/ murein hydrolase activator NlpD